MDYTKQELLNWGFERHGFGTLFGYGENGFAGSWFVRSISDVQKLPAHLSYSWKS